MSHKLTSLRLPTALARYEGRLLRPAVDASEASWLERLTGRSSRRLQHDRLRLAITVAGQKLPEPTEEAFQAQPFAGLLDALGDASLPSTDGSASPALWSHVVVRLFAHQNLLAPAERAFAGITLEHASSCQAKVHLSVPRVQAPSRTWRWRAALMETLLTGGVVSMGWLTTTQPANMLLIAGWTAVALLLFLSPLGWSRRRRAQHAARTLPSTPPIKWSLDGDSTGLGRLHVTVSPDHRSLTLASEVQGNLVAKSLNAEPCEPTRAPSSVLLRGRMVLRDVDGDDRLHVDSEVEVAVSGPAYTSLQAWLDGLQGTDAHAWVSRCCQATYGSVISGDPKTMVPPNMGTTAGQPVGGHLRGTPKLTPVSHALHHPC